MSEEMKTLDELVVNCDYDTKLAVTGWVFRNIVEHAKEGGSFRYLIYQRLGFGPDAYVSLYEDGGMEISNEFDLNFKDRITEIVRKEKYEALKRLLDLCDEPGCYSHASCGFPTENNGYRWTCSHHYDQLKGKKDENQSS